jgi:hypothetical protein
MYRATPKLVVLLAIAALVGAIFYVTRDGGGPAPRQPGVIYVDPGIGAR